MYILRKMKSDRGAARLIVYMAIVAVILLGIIIIPKILNYTDNKLQAVDDDYAIAAEHQAEVLFLQTGEAFSMVYDAKNKTFVEEKDAKRIVTPYGTVKEHKGHYLLVTVDEMGIISSKWITP